MAEQIAHVAMTTPASYGNKPLPKRNGPRGLLPSTWLNRQLRIEYTDAWGVGQETSGVLLDSFPTGPILNIRGGRTLLAWESVRLIELVE